jgi:hypothetical protein
MGVTDMKFRLDLWIFNLKKRANAKKSTTTLPALRNKTSAAASKMYPDMAPVVNIDLEKLTPEMLKAFFPSEHGAPQRERATDNVKSPRLFRTTTSSGTSREESSQVGETFGSLTRRPIDPTTSKPPQETASEEAWMRLHTFLNRSVAIFRQHATKPAFRSSLPQNIEKRKNQ